MTGEGFAFFRWKMTTNYGSCARENCPVCLRLWKRGAR